VPSWNEAPKVNNLIADSLTREIYMKISVIMALYNCEAFVEDSINSILSQDTTDFELIVTDDGSSDDTAGKLKQFNDSRLQVITLPGNCGIATALNVAMACVTGEYVAVMDSDDVALPQRLRTQAEFLDQHPEVHILGARAIRTTESIDTEIDRPQHPLSDGEIKANLLLLNGSAMLHPTMMARMNFLREQFLRYPPPPRGRVGNDHEFWIKCVARGAIFQTIPDVLLFKRRHANNITLLNNNPEIIRKKRITRSELLGLYYPELTMNESVALADMLEPNSEMSLINVCLGLAAGHKAMACGVSYYGESKVLLQNIIGSAMSAYLTPLSQRSR
jgi:glycosyltransferase involved in cell wall biosynthesis